MTMLHKVLKFNILAASLGVLDNYFDGLAKLFSDLQLAKFLDTSTKLFFRCYLENINISRFSYVYNLLLFCGLISIYLKLFNYL